MGFRQSRMRNAPCRGGPVGRGLARRGGESLRSVMSREDESEKMSVVDLEWTSPTLQSQCWSCVLMSRRREVGLGIGDEREGGRDDASLVVKERRDISDERTARPRERAPFAFGFI
jgi:hypothetical protein